MRTDSEKRTLATRSGQGKFFKKYLGPIYMTKMAKNVNVITSYFIHNI